MNYDAVIVGGGIVGLATAFRLLEVRPQLKILLLEKESKLAAHQTGNNSGVLHSGLYYKPCSEKARLSVSGLQLMTTFCREHGIAHEICGKIVVATSEEELPRLENLWKRGNNNGLQGLRKLNSAQIKEIKPYAAGIAAIHVPQEGIIDYHAVCEKFSELIRKRGGEIRLMPALKNYSRRQRKNSGNFRRKFLREICRHLQRTSF
jgi:(S)-2-hydroxyglutarate dehydrogenase